jgi:hypothetical protein
MRVRVLTPFMAPNLGAAGDVVELNDSQAKSLIAVGVVEDAGTAKLGPYVEPDAVAGEPVSTLAEDGAHPYPEPLPVHAKTEPASDEIRALGASEGGANPYPDPLPVGSGPYGPEEGVREATESDGAHPPFEPLPVAGEDEQVPATDQKGNANPEAVDEPIGGDDYDTMKVADLKAAAKALGVDATGKKATLVRRLRKARGA